MIWLVAYIAVGISLMSFMWFGSGNDLTVSELFKILLLAAVWPVVVIVVFAMFWRDFNVCNWVIWKRK